MKLLTKEIIQKLRKYPLYSQEGVEPMQKKVLVKFFNPYGVGTWIVTEAEEHEEGNDWIFYGLVDLGNGYEWGYFYFNELNRLRINVWGCKLPIERDLYISKNCLVKELVRADELM